MSGDVWRSLHVHRFGSQDTFLTDGLAPVLSGLRSESRVRGAFFLRYWEGGHHVRVRVRTDPADADAVVADLAEAVRRYLREHPDDVTFDLEEFMRTAQPTMAALEGVPAGVMYPPDTVREATYAPEYAKYGGADGVAIAEEFFDHSTSLVLAALPQLAGRPGRRLGLGFTMLLRGLCAAGLSPDEMAAFFRHYCFLWSPYVFDEFLDTWPELLTERRGPVVAQARRLFAERPLTDGYSTAVGAAVAAVDANPTVLTAVTLAGADAAAARRRQVLLVSYLHTHNNRLGLTPEQEAFLGFLGHHVLSEWAGTTPDSDLLNHAHAIRTQRLGALAPAAF